MNTLSPSSPDLTFQFKSGPSFRVVDEAIASDKTLPSSKFGELHTLSKHGDRRKEKQCVSQTSTSNALNTHSSQTSIVGNKKAKLSRSIRDKKNLSTSSSKAQKRANPEPDSYPNPNHGLPLILLPFASHGGVSDLVQEQGHNNPRRSDSSDKGSPNGHHGLVRRGVSSSLEAHLPNYHNQHKSREHSFWITKHRREPKSVVEIPHGHSINLRKGSLGVEQAKVAISCAPLRRIGLACRREESDQFQGVDINTHGECTYVEVVPESQSSQEVRSSSLLQRIDLGDIELLGGVEVEPGGI